MANWLQKIFCSGLAAESTAKTESIRLLVEENGDLKRKLAQSNARTIVPDFIFNKECIKTLSGSELQKILFKEFPGAEIKLADGMYQFTTLAEVQRWASFDPTNELVYRAEELDCDKFALTDMADFKKENNYQLGNGIFGIAWGNSPQGFHAWNIAYVDEGIIMLEPQTDKIWKWVDNKEYLPDFIYI